MSVLAKRLIGEESSDLVKDIAHKGVSTDQWALQIDGWDKTFYLRPDIRWAGQNGWVIQPFTMGDIHEEPSFYSTDHAKAAMALWAKNYAHIRGTLRMVPDYIVKERTKR